MFGPTIDDIELLLLKHDNELLIFIADMLNSVLRCIPNTTGKISIRTAAEQKEIAKRHTHDKTV